MRRNALWIALAALSPLPLTGQEHDVDQLERELVRIFERPAGQPISQAQKDALGQFLTTHEGHLGRLGYVRGLHSYLTREYETAAAQLDAWFEKHDEIRVEEHRTMVGRVYMNSFIRLTRLAEPDTDTVARYGERAVRYYADLALLGRYMPRALSGLDDPKTIAAARVALVRGALDSDAPSRVVDDFLKSLYAGTDAPAAPVQPRRQAGKAPSRARETPDQKVRDALMGQPAPGLDPSEILAAGGVAATDLPATTGKVVLIDFWATWCAPCRKVIPHLVDLQKKHGDDLQVIGATRFYGYGADFSGPDAKPPHGGAKTVRNLDREQELTINQTFSKVFELNYPIAFVDRELFGTYGIRGIPTVFVVGRDGKIAGHVVGANDPAAIDRLVEAALKR